MPRRSPDGTVPSWSRLCKLAASQLGYFTRRQALTAGFSPQLLQYYIRKEMVERTHPRVLHLRQQPREQHEDLIALWLWSRQQGVFSHGTALRLHQLCDTAPEVLTLTMPASWRRRRVRLPPQSAMYYADLPTEEVCQHGPLQLTTPLRTLVDCVQAGIDPQLVEQAVRHAVRRKLVTRARLERALRQAQQPAIAAKPPRLTAP